MRALPALIFLWLSSGCFGIQLVSPATTPAPATSPKKPDDKIKVPDAWSDCDKYKRDLANNASDQEDNLALQQIEAADSVVELSDHALLNGKNSCTAKTCPHTAKLAELQDQMERIKDVAVQIKLNMKNAKCDVNSDPEKRSDDEDKETKNDAVADVETKEAAQETEDE